MRGVRGFMLVGMAGLMSGCASSSARQTLARLQSQVGLLNERVAQLERSSATGNTPSVSVSEPSTTETFTTTTEPATTPKLKASATHKGKMSAKSSLKPTTREIQQALKNAGFYQGTVDGKMGNATREAIKEFQRINGLKQDGVVGKQTWTKLHAYASLSSTNGEANAAEVLK